MTNSSIIYILLVYSKFPTQLIKIALCYRSVFAPQKNSVPIQVINHAALTCCFFFKFFFFLILFVNYTYRRQLNCKILRGGRVRSRDQTHSECSSNLVKILPQIQGFPLLVRILPLNLSRPKKNVFTEFDSMRGEDQTKKVVTARGSIFGRYLGFIEIIGIIFLE